MAKNKVKYGLTNVYYALMTVADGVVNYGTPVRINGAVNLSGSASGDREDFYADNILYYSDTANQGYEGDLECAILPESFYTDILGYTKDANGALIESADAKTKNFALGFEVSGDVSGRRTWYYNCNASRPNDDASTLESSKTPSTATLSIRMMPRETDNKVKVSLTQTDDNADAYEEFFSKVYEEATTDTSSDTSSDEA